MNLDALGRFRKAKVANRDVRDQFAPANVAIY